MKRMLFVCIAALIAAGCFMPATNDTRGILMTDNEFTYSGIRETYEALSIKNHNQSDAGLFVEFGADSCFVAEYRRGSERYTVDAYSFKTEKGAIGAYFLTGLLNSSPADIGYYGRKSDSAVQFVKGRHLMHISPAGGGNSEGAAELASVFDTRIGGGRFVPNLYFPIPETNRVADTELYFEGIRGFESRFGPDLRKALQVEYALDGTAGKFVVGTGMVDLIRLRFASRRDVLDAVNSFLSSRKDLPIVHATDNRSYGIVYEEDNTEVYIAEYGDILYIMLGAKPDKKGLDFFEYVLRGGK